MSKSVFTLYLPDLRPSSLSIWRGLRGLVRQRPRRKDGQRAAGGERVAGMRRGACRRVPRAADGQRARAREQEQRGGETRELDDGHVNLGMRSLALARDGA